MRMLGKIVYNVATTAITVVSGLARNKIFATFLTLNLFGILSIAQQSAGLLYTLFALGLPLGITTLSSQVLTKPRQEQVEVVSRMLVLVMALATFFGLVLVAVWIQSPNLIAKLVTGREEYAIPVGILLLASPFMLMQNCLYSVMEGMGDAKRITVFRVLPSVVVLPIIYLLTARYHLVGGAIGLLTNEILMTGLGMFLLRKMIRLDAAALDIRPIFSRLFKVAALSFGVGVTWFAIDFFMKRYVLALLGEVDNGIVQSTAKIVDLYPNVALSWLSMHLFPVIAIAADDRVQVARALERTTLIAISLIVPIIIALFALRSEVLTIVYKSEFAVAEKYLGAMLSVGVVKVFSWVLGMAMIPLGMKKKWFYASMIVVAVYAVVVWVGLQIGWGIYAIPTGLGVAFSVQALYILNVYRENSFSFAPVFIFQSAVFLVVSGLFVASVFWLPTLVAASAVYCWLIYRYNLVREIKERFYEFWKKTAA